MGVIKVPLEPPSFTIKELRDAIPAHLFERSALKSSAYLIFDLVVVSALFYLATFIGLAPLWAQFILWPTYWVVQGAFMTGIWVIAHECGHQSFSESRFINNAVGLVFHSLLLVPYHPWRITHGMHHKATAHMERDQVFVPAVRSKAESQGLQEVLEESPLWSLWTLFVMSTMGWPGYLLFNVSGQEYSRRANHFEPDSPIFKPEHHWDVVISDIALLIVLGVLGWFSWTYSFASMVMYYLVPYLWVNFWLVTITYLQHTDAGVPHYRGSEWTFVRGALATIDRDFGILNHIFHHITDSHVAHHLFSTMPHYNAIEATPYLKKFLGEYYLQDNTPVIKALWRSWRTCHFVDEGDGDILFYKTKGEKKEK